MEFRNRSMKRFRSESTPRDLTERHSGSRPYRQCFPGLLNFPEFPAWDSVWDLDNYNGDYCNDGDILISGSFPYITAVKIDRKDLCPKKRRIESESKQIDDPGKRQSDSEAIDPEHQTDRQDASKRHSDSEAIDLEHQTDWQDPGKIPSDSEVIDPEHQTDRQDPDTKEVEANISTDSFVVITADTSESSAERSFNDDTTPDTKRRELEKNSSTDDEIEDGFVVISADASVKSVEDDSTEKSSCAIF